MNKFYCIAFLFFVSIRCCTTYAQQQNRGGCCDKKILNNSVPLASVSMPAMYSKTITLLPGKSVAEEPPFFSSIDIVPPEGMVLVPAGYCSIGRIAENETSSLSIRVKPFYMDEHPVTVKQFRQFVNATGYITNAEQFGNSAFIDSTSGYVWILKQGANWQYPQGADYPAAQDDHPVTQISWNDAQAYCKWAGKRLPNEFEFEYAAKGATDSKNIYPWGDSLIIGGEYKANVWQGSFPTFNSLADGFKFTSPVGYFGKNKLGLADMSGNVWQWCENDKSSYETLINPTAQGVFKQPTTEEKALRGGSFLCEPEWCHGYRITGRSGSAPETALMHVGFRCVKDIQ